MGADWRYHGAGGVMARVEHGLVRVDMVAGLPSREMQP